MNHDQIATKVFKAKFLAKTTMAYGKADAVIGSAKSELVFLVKKHGRDLQPADPTWNTMDCSVAAARPEHRLEESLKRYSREVCGLTSRMEENTEAVMVIRTGFNPVGIDDIRPWVPAGYPGPPSQESYSIFPIGGSAKEHRIPPD